MRRDTADEALARLKSEGPRPRQDFNSGAIGKLEREGKAIVYLDTSPFKVHRNRRIQWVKAK